MNRHDAASIVFSLVAVVVLVGLFNMYGCAGSGETGESNLRDTTASDLQNTAFTFADGGVFHAVLADQEATLEFGQFDASNSASFRLQSGGLIASGTATHQSPLTLTPRIIEPGLPFTIDQDMRFNAEIDNDTGSLALENTQTTITTTSTPGMAVANPPVLLLATFNGAQEVPPVTTTASGTATLTFDAEQTKIVFMLQYTGLTAVQEAHIHVGAVADRGDIVFFLCTNSTTPVPENTPPCPETAGMVTGTLTATELQHPASGSGIVISTFADAVSVMLNSNTYGEVLTEAFPDGEIRGQIGHTTTQPPPMVSFAADILPIFTSIDLGFGFIGCGNADCHAGSNPPAGLNLTASQAYNNLVGVPSTQNPLLNRVEPGDPENSYLFRKHTGEGITGARMPLTNPTFFDDNADLLELERLWIEQGALNN
jgi:hypothetical protein